MGDAIVCEPGRSGGCPACPGPSGLGDPTDLRGGGIAIVAQTSGFVSGQRKLVREAGIDIEAITLKSLGGIGQRAAALREGRTDATLLTMPWSARGGA
jgi:hypothetical protein